MRKLKPIQTEYNGYLFRSRLEARWAVFFDACGVEYEYEPEGYHLDNGLLYLPDFLLHGVVGRAGGDLFVEVKGKMTELDAQKINCFVDMGFPETAAGCLQKSATATLVVGNIPAGEDIYDIDNDISYRAYQSVNTCWPYEFNFETIDGDHFGAHPGINKSGYFELFGDDSNYLCDRDDAATEKAYRLARQARFEHSATSRVFPVRRKS